METVLQPWPWQKDRWDYFQRLIRKDHLAHAVMLTGLAGLGKEQFARLLSQSIFCDAVSAEGVPCGQCASCHQFQAETLTDFRHIGPEGDSASITVDQVRATIEFLELSHEQGRRKIAMISPADWMNVNAANSLLKTLEEPSGDALIILVASQPERLPVTIRSRCQLVNFESPSLIQGAQWLREKGFEEPELALAVVGGAPLSALGLLEEQGTEEFHGIITGILWSLSGSRSSHDIVSAWSSIDVEVLLNRMVLVSEWFIRLSMGLRNSGLESYEFYRALQTQADRFDPSRALLRHEKLLKLKQRRGVSLNHELLLDHLQLLWLGRA